jgi:hypothetical protein
MIATVRRDTDRHDGGRLDPSPRHRSEAGTDSRMSAKSRRDPPRFRASEGSAQRSETGFFRSAETSTSDLPFIAAIIMLQYPVAWYGSACRGLHKTRHVSQRPLKQEAGHVRCLKNHGLRWPLAHNKPPALVVGLPRLSSCLLEPDHCPDTGARNRSPDPFDDTSSGIPRPTAISSP